MAETPFVTAVLVAVLAVHLFGVGTPVFAEVPCPERCNLGHGFCEPSGKCRCQPGWEGENCERCSRAPGCMHGTCHQPWQCNCRLGWGGPRCTRDLRICERTRPCLNQATCINNGIGGYLCVCQPGFWGMRCENYTPGGIPDNKPTTSLPTTTTTTTTRAPKVCKNGGKCKIYSLQGGCDRCICHPGYVGRHCEVNVNECLMRPCTNDGKCFDLTNDFYCECQRGYTGRYCSDDVDECSLASDMCYNGGVCKNTYGSFECTCPQGFTGRRCENELPRPKGAHRPLVPRIVRLSTTSAVTTTAAETTDETDETPRKHNIIKNTDTEVKMTRITHEVKISSVNGDFSAANNEVLIRSEVDSNPNSGDSSQAMQTITFVFMGLAVVILGAIFAVVWLRCLRNQSKSGGNSGKNRTPDCEVPQTQAAISAVDKEIHNNRSSAAVVTVDSISESLDDMDEASMQVQPCLSRRCEDATNHVEQRQIRDSCPSPPPPYTLSALDARRSQAQSRPGYYVALPPAHQDFSESRKPLNSTSYSMTSNDPEETSSLLEADTPTMSHKIMV